MSGRHGPDNADHYVVLFDGVCNLCESTVRFIIRRDRDSRFRFASLQSDVASQLMEPFDHACEELSSVLLIEDGRLYRKARAGLRIAKRLDGAWPLFYYRFFWVPAFIANPVYEPDAPRGESARHLAAIRDLVRRGGVPVRDGRGEPCEPAGLQIPGEDGVQAFPEGHRPSRAALLAG